MQSTDDAKLLDEQENCYWGELALQAAQEPSLSAEQSMAYLNNIKCNDNVI